MPEPARKSVEEKGKKKHKKSNERWPNEEKKKEQKQITNATERCKSVDRGLE